MNVDLDRLYHPAVVDYLSNSDRRIVAGARRVLQVLDIPYPEYLKLKPAGRPASPRLMEEFRKDYPQQGGDVTIKEQTDKS
jgi:hypothetical protein